MGYAHRQEIYLKFNGRHFSLNIFKGGYCVHMKHTVPNPYCANCTQQHHTTILFRHGVNLENHKLVQMI